MSAHLFLHKHDQARTMFSVAISTRIDRDDEHDSCPPSQRLKEGPGTVAARFQEPETSPAAVSTGSKHCLDLLGDIVRE